MQDTVAIISLCATLSTATNSIT